MAKPTQRIDDYQPDHRFHDERGATEQRFRKAEGDFEIGDVGIAAMRDSPLERAHVRGVITGGQYQAGSKFRIHWYHAGLTDSLKSLDLGRIFSGDAGSFSGMCKSENQVFHRQRYRDAVDKLGDKNRYVLEWMICREEPLERIGNGLGWKEKKQAIAAATQQARNGLDILCNIWGIDPSGG